jgi:hypothetical protein
MPLLERRVRGSLPGQSAATSPNDAVTGIRLAKHDANLAPPTRPTFVMRGVPLRFDTRHPPMLHDEPQRSGDRAEHCDQQRGGQPLVVSIGGRNCRSEPDVVTGAVV